MAKNNNLGDFLKDVADGIRAKKGTTALINAQNFRSEIESIETLPAGVSVNGTEITIDTDQYTAVITGQAGDDQTGKVVISGLNIPVELDTNTESSVIVTNLTPENVKKNTTILGVIGTLDSLPNGVSINGTTITVDTDQYTAVIAGQDGDDQTGKVVISGLNIPVELDPNNDSSVQVTNLTPANVKKGTTILGVTGIFESGVEGSLKKLLDATKSCYYLFYNYGGTSVNGLIQYSDTSKVINMGNMFYNCSNLTSIPQLDTSNVINMTGIFYNCSKLTSIPSLNTSKVENMQGMFSGCKNLTTVPQLDTSKVTDMQNMFNGCYSLTTIPELNTGNVTTMMNMFYNCTGLTTIPLLNTSKVTNMYYMLRNCSGLTTIPQFDTSNVTTMQYMFTGCSNLTTIPLLDTSKVSPMNGMFANCTSLTTVPALDVSNATNLSGMFSGCTNLKSILMHGMKENFNISSSTKFERADLVTILNNLATVTSSKTLTMGETNLAKLTEADKAIAINKG